MWLSSVTVWLKPRLTVAIFPCKRGSRSEIYRDESRAGGVEDAESEGSVARPGLGEQEGQEIEKGWVKRITGMVLSNQYHTGDFALPIFSWLIL